MKSEELESNKAWARGIHGNQQQEATTKGIERFTLNSLVGGILTTPNTYKKGGEGKCWEFLQAK